MRSLLMVALCYSAALANNLFTWHPPIKNTRDYRMLGDVVKVKKFPYMVSLRNNRNSFHCGATILTPFSLLSTAHCCKTGKAVKVTAGLIDQNGFDQIIDIEAYISHKHFDDSVNDICVIKLRSPLQYNDRVQPVKLPRHYPNIPTGAPLVAIGWGAIEAPPPRRVYYVPSSRRLEVLRYYRYLPNGDCKRSFLNHYLTPRDTQLCAISSPRVGACHGDSGGPLLWGDVQVGITSFGLVRLVRENPAAFTPVFAYIDWIRNVLGPEARLLQFGP